MPWDYKYYENTCPKHAQTSHHNHTHTQKYYMILKWILISTVQSKTLLMCSFPLLFVDFVDFVDFVESSTSFTPLFNSTNFLLIISSADEITTTKKPLFLPGYSSRYLSLFLSHAFTLSLFLISRLVESGQHVERSFSMIPHMYTREEKKTEQNVNWTTEKVV